MKMNKINIAIILMFLFTAIVSAQGYRVKVTMNDSTVAVGELLKLDSIGVEINPGGLVLYRFIPENRIKQIYIAELDTTIVYPVTNSILPLGVRLKNAEVNRVMATFGFPHGFLRGQLGYGSTSNSEYYKGFHDGFTFSAGMHYYFGEHLPDIGRFFAGVSYNYLSAWGDKIYGLEPKLTVQQISVEFGRTFNMVSNAGYFHLLCGVVYTNNEMTIPIPQASTEVSYKDDRTAIRMEFGYSRRIIDALFFTITPSVDMILLKEKERDAGGSGNAGTIYRIILGLSYGFY